MNDLDLQLRSQVKGFGKARTYANRLGVWGKLELRQTFCCKLKLHEVVQMFVVIDYVTVREMT